MDNKSARAPSRLHRGTNLGWWIGFLTPILLLALVFGGVYWWASSFSVWVQLSFIFLFVPFVVVTWAIGLILSLIVGAFRG